MRAVAVLAVLLATTAHASAEPPPERVLAKDVTGNHELQLKSAWISEARGQNLMASFVVVGAAKAEPITIRFPAHSHTTHEITLMNIIHASVNWREPASRYEPHEATLQPVFSAPKDANGYITNYEKWWFVSFRPRNEEPGKPGS